MDTIEQQKDDLATEGYDDVEETPAEETSVDDASPVDEAPVVDEATVVRAPPSKKGKAVVN